MYYRVQSRVQVQIQIMMLHSLQQKKKAKEPCCNRGLDRSLQGPFLIDEVHSTLYIYLPTSITIVVEIYT